MKRILLLWVGVSISCVAFVHAWNPPDYSTAMTGDTRQVTISTTAALPTQLCTKDTFIQRTWIINPSTFTIFISSVSTNLSTSTSFAIPGAPTNAPPVFFSPDGVNSAYAGPIFGIANGNTPPAISIYRSK